MTALLVGCAALTERSPGEPTTAYADAQGTLLARIAVASLPMGVAAGDVPSGFRLLPRGEFAFDARVALVQRAERSIDLQYYQWQPDHSGRALLRALRDAAARGVRVRLLLDDYHAATLEELLLDLGAHDHVQIRLFNPLALRRGAPTARLLLSPGDFELHNHRMHNKVLVADNALAVFGGRNIGDGYSMSHPDYRVEMLRLGVQIYEFSPELIRRSSGFGFRGPSSAQLHAKVAVVDVRLLLVVGSVNLDPRSAVGNTEMSVVIDSPPLAADLVRLSEEKSQRAMMHRLRLQPDGRTIEWLSRDERSQLLSTTDEPGSNPLLKLKLWLQSLFVDERLL